MRLWHEALIPYLPRQQLLGLHREVCALRGLGWGKPHSVVNYVFDHPYGWLVAYHFNVMEEMEIRGYKVDPLWKRCGYRGKSKEKLPLDEARKVHLKVSEIYSLQGQTFKYIYPEHNSAYLQECLENLTGKGIHIDMGE